MHQLHYLFKVLQHFICMHVSFRHMISAIVGMTHSSLEFSRGIPIITSTQLLPAWRRYSNHSIPSHGTARAFLLTSSSTRWMESVVGGPPFPASAIRGIRPGKLCSPTMMYLFFSYFFSMVQAHLNAR
jgi:hypothetical protein